MKQFNPIRALLLALSAALALAILAGCSSSKSQADRKTDTVTAADLEGTPEVRIEELIQGRVAGVQIRQTADGRIYAQIRGTSTIQGNPEPLYVVDGFPVEPGPGGTLPGLTVRDIAAIEVLKNASDTAIYGVRGANGVIVVTTKAAAGRKGIHNE